MDLWPKASALQTKGMSGGSRRKESGRVCVFIELLRELITKKQAEVVAGEGCWALVSDRGDAGKRWGRGGISLPGKEGVQIYYKSPQEREVTVKYFLNERRGRKGNNVHPKVEETSMRRCQSPASESNQNYLFYFYFYCSKPFY